MDNAPMPTTLESIAASLIDLRKSIDDRFQKAADDRRQLKSELKSELKVEIEALETKVDRVYDEVIGTREEVRAIRSEHATFTQLFDNHEIRIRAFESKKP